MEWVQTVAPEAEPLTLAETKKFLRVDVDDEDALIGNLIVAAREHAEVATQRQLMLATWRYSLETFPTEIVLPRPPLSSITTITYVDGNGTRQTLGATLYQQSEDEPVRVKPAYGQSWPSCRAEYNSVQVTYVAGYATRAAVPEAIRTGMLFWVQALYDRDTREVDMLRQAAEHLFLTKRVFWNQPP